MIVFCFACLSLTSFSLQADELKAKKETKKKNSGSNALALGAVLPEGVYRVNVVTFLKTTDSTFDAKGKSIPLGFTNNVTGMAFALEYGLTNNLSLSFKLPVVMSNKLSYDPKSLIAANRDKYNLTKKMVKAGLEKAGLPLTNLNELARNKFGDTFNQASSGITGVADIEVGALYNWISSDRIVFSTGLGMKFPTGKYYAPQIMRPIGGGLYVLALRNNLDIAFFEKNLWLSFEHQGEVALSKARAPFESTNPFKLDDSKKVNFTKEGIAHRLTAQTSTTFGALSEYLKFLSVSVGYKLDSEAPTMTDYLEYATKRSYTHSVIGNVSLSALPYKIPLAFDFDFQKPLAGQNAGAADTASLMTFNLKGYLKF